MQRHVTGNVKGTSVPYLWAPSILSFPAFIARPNALNLPRDVHTRPSTWRLAAALKRNGAEYFLEHAQENNNNNTNSRESRAPDELLWCKSGPSVCIVASVLNWTLETASPRLFHRPNKTPFCSYQFFPFSVFPSTALDLSASVPLGSVTSYFRCVTRRRFCVTNRWNVCSPSSVHFRTRPLIAFHRLCRIRWATFKPSPVLLPLLNLTFRECG